MKAIRCKEQNKNNPHRTATEEKKTILCAGFSAAQSQQCCSAPSGAADERRRAATRIGGGQQRGGGREMCRNVGRRPTDNDARHRRSRDPPPGFTTGTAASHHTVSTVTDFLEAIARNLDGSSPHTKRKTQCNEKKPFIFAPQFSFTTFVSEGFPLLRCRGTTRASCTRMQPHMARRLKFTSRSAPK